mmetsp:Transcript_92979/g.161604  ORF Transcript_92979/g.161604 Transcript_92979/m.161604 type:complete len:133 (-) Transcript_92979:1401-1799(-)
MTVMAEKYRINTSPDHIRFFCEGRFIMLIVVIIIIIHLRVCVNFAKPLQIVSTAAKALRATGAKFRSWSHCIGKPVLYHNLVGARAVCQRNSTFPLAHDDVSKMWFCDAPVRAYEDTATPSTTKRPVVVRGE